MRSDIRIGGRDIPVVSNAATPVIYRQVFHEDLLVFLQELSTARKNKTIMDGTSDMLCKLAYIMQAQAEKDTTTCFRSLSLEKFLEWLEDFAPLDFEFAGGAILNAYYQTENTASKSKNG